MVIWIASAESRSVRGASHQPIFMGDCLTICHTYFALSALVMDQLLCTWYCLSECRCYVVVNQVWPRVYVTAKRACYFG